MTSHSQRSTICTILTVLICFTLLGTCYTRNNYFSNLDLRTQTLNPAVTGFKITGNAADDRLGYSMSRAGDVNNDGYDDIIIGAYHKNGRQGAAYVIYGGEESVLLDVDLSTTSLDPLTTGFMITGNAAGNEFGHSVSAAGDIDGDGYDDIIIGAPQKDGARGAAYVIYGKSKPSMSNINLSSTTLNPASTGFMITGNAAADCLGYSVSTAGDIDNDGYDDIIVGAYYKNNVRGAAYVIYGGSRATRTNIVLSSTALNPASTGFTMLGATGGNNFGCSVSTAGDINNDGYDDIIVGALQTNSWQGAAYVIYGGTRVSRTNWDFSSSTALNPTSTGFKVTGNAAGDQLGYSVSTAGDINNDGYDDIIIGAPLNSAKGAAYVIYGGTKATRTNIALGSTPLNPLTTGFTIIGNAANDGLGISVSTAGDLNKDGFDDIIVGAYYKSTGGTAYVIYGGTKATRTNIALSSTTLNPTSTGFTITGNFNSWLGFQVTRAGDINKDGYDDIIVAAPLKDSSRGTVYVIYASCPPTCKQCSSETVCTECQTPYLLYESKCLLSCPIATVATTTTCEDCSANCNHCSSPSVCTECKNSYLMYQSECFATCPEGTLATSPTTCEDCPANCNTCSSTSVCTECKNSYLMYQSECFATCPEGTLATSSTTCEDCPANCNTCSSTSVCTECQSPYYLYQSECFATCPEGTLATSPTTCEDCPANCNTCSSTSVCTECKNSYLMYQSECFASCPDTTFASTATSCEDCSTNCNHCTSSSSCTECVSPFVLYESQCLASCPQGTFNSDNKCKSCPSYCSSCTSENSCQTCDQGFNLATLCVA